MLVTHRFTMRSAGAFSTATATLSLLGLPVVAIASKFAGVRQLLEANTALLAAAAAAAIACETLGGSEAVWAGAAELSTSGAAGGAAAASGVLWWAPHTTLLLLALGGTAGPVLLLALVPTLHLGFSLGHAYGELETLSVLGQACVCVCVHAPAHAYMRVHSHGRWLYVRSHARAWLQAGFTLLLGAARTGYGFKGALWALQLALLGGCVAARAYARASTEVAEDVRLLLAGEGLATPEPTPRNTAGEGRRRWLSTNWSRRTRTTLAYSPPVHQQSSRNIV